MTWALKSPHLGKSLSHPPRQFPIKDPQAVKHLIAALNDKDQGVREAAGRALAEIPQGQEFLKKALKEGNLIAIASAYHFFMRLGDPNAEYWLNQALLSYGTKEMAEAFLNCDNKNLKNATTQWAERLGYKIEKTDKFSSYSMEMEENY